MPRASATHQQIRDALHRPAGDHVGDGPAWEGRPLGSAAEVYAAELRRAPVIPPPLGGTVLVALSALERAYDRARPAANAWVRGQFFVRLRDHQTGPDRRYVRCTLIGAQVRDATYTQPGYAPATCMPEDELVIQVPVFDDSYTVRAGDCDLESALSRPLTLAPTTRALREDDRQ